MAVNPGHVMRFDDLQTLAAKANGKISYDATTAPSGLKRYVSPLYPDGGGSAWGNRIFQDIEIDKANSGTGYVVGDTVSAGFSSSYFIVQTGAGGSVLGIRVLNNGAGAYGDTATSPISTSTSGSGTGLKLKFSAFGQYGPTAPYDFGISSLGSINFGGDVYGKVSDCYLVNAGSGYTAGDTIGFVELPLLVITIATVDGGGAILTFSVTTGTNAIVVPQNVQNLIGIGGTGVGAVFGGLFTLALKPNWRTEINRLRANINTAISGITGIWKSVSGPWPIGSPNPNYRDQEFYFPDTGSTVNLTLTSSTSSIGSQTEEWYPYDVYYENGVVKYPVYRELTSANKKITFTLVVGGDAPVTMLGVISVPCAYMMGGRFDGATSTWGSIVDAPSISVVAAPFGTVSIEENNSSTPSFSPPTPGLKNVYVCISVNQTVAPGEYTFVFETPESAPEELHYIMPGSVVDYYLACSKLSFSAFSGAGAGVNFTGAFSHPTGGNVSFSGTFSVTRTISAGAVATNGIHGTQNVFKIPLGKDADGVNALFGYRKYLQDSTNPFSDPGAFTLPTWQPSYLDQGPVMFGWTLSSLPAGLWVGRCPMISNALAVTAALMPWNYQRTKYGSAGSVQVNPMLLGDLAPNSPANVARVSNGYTQAVPVESQTELPSWQANRYFTVGFNVVDYNGNIQIVTTAGTSGASAPTWSDRENITTSDNGVVWNCRRVLSSSASWIAGTLFAIGDAIRDSNGYTQVVIVGGFTGSTAPIWGKLLGQRVTDNMVTWEMRVPFVPLAHRQAGAPVYPFYWFSETNAFLKPPTSTSGLTRWGANNQWQRNVYNSPSYDVGWQQDNKAYGWFIYSVSLNRTVTPIKTLNAIGSGDAGVGAGDTGTDTSGISGTEVSVTIGCIRSGAFVAFGTWATGQTIQVMWPVFTSDALVYQCSERVDIQALAIASSGASVTVGATANDFPIFAAYSSDPSNLLDLLP